MSKATANPLGYALPYARKPTAYFAQLLHLPCPALLHSAEQVSGFGQYDILTADPIAQLIYADGVFRSGAQVLTTKDPFAALAQRHAQLATGFGHCTDGVDNAAKSPFTGGFIGYFGYGLHQQLEHHLATPQDPTGIPAMAGGFYDFAIVTDHYQQTTMLYTRSIYRQQQVLGWLAAPSAQFAAASVQAFHAGTTGAQYRRQFDTIQDYLHAGDAYQVNLAIHYAAAYRGHPWTLYQRWCQRQPAPFSAYLELPPSAASKECTAILSLSPERFLQVQAQTATVSPIKGTRARGNTATTDAALAKELVNSDKDRAENLMIVDLLRNDLGRVCEVGSVSVTKLHEPIAFSNVHHLVSTVQGQLLTDNGPLAAFAALFPSGSITGAPKLRAIDIINELEPVARSIYCGSIGYWDFNGNFDSNVAIRTAVASQGQLHLWGGGGLVADSDVDAEQHEIEAKIGRLLRP